MADTTHMQDAHIHQDWWVWCIPDPHRPGKFLLINQCSVCKHGCYIYPMDEVPAWAATEPPPEADGYAWTPPEVGV